MTSDTIDNDVTMSGAGATLLVGRYRMVKQLGRGGMGSVWLSEDTQLDDKKFAIKMLPSILVCDKRAYRQLKSEALVAMKLSHPNIVTLRDFEENNGNPFLVMDYIDGQTLDDYLAERETGIGNRESVARDGESGTGNGELGTGGASSLGGLPEDEVVRILKPIAAALDYAHKEGVVHRDVKPANVMIRKDGTPYILDFGISREMQETMTRVTGKLSSGTLLYMSPEQLHGAPPKKGQDIYSFAAMAYECMSGHPPFCRGQIEFQIDNDMPEPLVGRVAPATAESVGRDDLIAPLVAGIMSGLAKKPEDRPATCAGVLSGDDVSRAGIMHVERVEDGRVRSSGAPQGGKGRLWKAIGILSFVIGALGLGTLLMVKRHNTMKLVLPGGATMEMIYVAPGSFIMGSPYTNLQHRVTLTKGYWLGKYEVTQAQWQSVMGTNPSSWKGDDLPVESVSWEKCQEFIKDVNASLNCGARLPTEAEWEYACRAGEEGAYGRRGKLDDIAWYNNTSGFDWVVSSFTLKTHSVGKKKPNAWGFYDMHGNVSEWCQDWYGDYSGNATDPTGPASGDYRVLRGGYFDSYADNCRSCTRDRHLPGYDAKYCGFRLCCDAEPRE